MTVPGAMHMECVGGPAIGPAPGGVKGDGIGVIGDGYQMVVGCGKVGACCQGHGPTACIICGCMTHSVVLNV